MTALLGPVAADLLVGKRGLSRAQYDVLVEAGLLEGEPVELLEGALVEVAPQGEQHATAIEELGHHLARRLPEPWRLRVQLPLAATDRSEPEPDLAVVQRTGPGHPRTAALVVEVAVSSHRTALVHKAPVYAAAGVEQHWVLDVQHWVLDVPARQVVVHAEPGPGGYATVRRLPWTAPLAVLGVDVDLAALLAPSG